MQFVHGLTLGIEMNVFFGMGCKVPKKARSSVNHLFGPYPSRKSSIARFLVYLSKDTLQNTLDWDGLYHKLHDSILEQHIYQQRL